MNVKCFSLIAAACVATGFVTAARAAVAINFDGGTGLDQITAPASNPFFLTTSTPTVGDTSLKPGNSAGSITDGRGTYNGSTFALGINQSITTTIKFARGAVTGTGTPIVQLGFGTAAIGSFDNGGAGTALYSRALATALGSGVGVTPVVQPTFSLVSDNKAVSAGTASEATGVAGFTLDNPGGNPFYLYSETLTRTGTNTFTQTVSVKLLDTDKATPIGTIAGFTSATLTNALVAAAADAGTLYAGLRATTPAGNLRLDDYTISDVSTVPEPAALGVLGLGGVMLRRRRR